ncbi:MAG: glycosyltransferase [Candidatus Nitrosopumilus sp. bin_68KS]
MVPLTLKEAQLMGKSVIETNVERIHEMMKEKISGFLVKEGDPDDLIEKLSILLNNEELRVKMGKEGRKFVEESFSWDVVTQKNYWKYIIIY